MSQEQPQWREADEFPPQEAVKYGNVLHVSGELAGKPIAPRDAATVQAAESVVLGKPIRGGPAATMQSAADANVKAGVLSPDSVTDAARREGVSFARSEEGGNEIITESIGGQALGRFVAPAASIKPGMAARANAVTVGEALQAAAFSAGDKPVEQADAAAIQAAEARATCAAGTQPGGVAPAAQIAAARNERTGHSEEGKATLSDILVDAKGKMAGDKPAKSEDAETAIEAEVRNNPEKKTTPGGVAESLAEAARINQA